MTPEQFDQLAREGYNRIPLVREVLADLETPLSIFLKLANRPYSYLFESVQGGERWGRYSFIGLPARTLVRVHGHDITVETDGAVMEQTTETDPLAWIEAYQARFKAAELPGLPRFTGGLVGYFGFETVRLIEPRLEGPEKPDALGLPDILLMVSEEVVVYDNLSGRLYLVVHADTTQAGACIARYAKQVLPNYSVFDEQRYFVAGDAPCVVELDGWQIGLTVCEDIWQPSIV